MRIATTKQPFYLKQLGYEAFAAGTTSDVWCDDDWKKEETKSTKQKPSDKWDA